MERLFILCLLVSILGIFTLLLVSLQIKPLKVSSYSQLKENDYISVSGKIISAKYFQDSDFSILKLENNITIICNCRFQVSQTIYAEGKVEKYNNNLQINADKININNN